MGCCCKAIAHTIDSQLAALSERAQADGSPVPAERRFVNNGYSGATLVRPALDHLRDLVALGGIDRAAADTMASALRLTPVKLAHSPPRHANSI
jgi:hypothetical protein